nr:Cytochrome P450 [Sitophilus oryzae]
MIFVVILIGIFFVYYFYIRPFSYWKKRGVKQGKPWFFFGDTWPMIFRVMDMATNVSSVYQQMPDVRYYGAYQFSTPKIVIRDPDLIKAITVKDFDHFTDHVAMVDPKADPLFGKNLLGLRGDEWRNMRATLTTSFTSSRIKTMFELISEAAENYIKYFLNKNSKVVEIEAKETFSRYTIDVIATTSFGVKVDSLGDKNNEFFRMGKEISEIKFTALIKILIMQLSLKLYRFLNLAMFRKEVNQFFTSLIEDTIRTREEKNIYRPDMLQNLIEARKQNPGTSKAARNFTNEDITAQAVIFFFAGFDSVSSVMTFLSYELAINQTIQNKLREEIYATLKENDGNVTYEAIVHMKYLDMVVSEALRKWPPFVLLGRECTKTYVIEPQSPTEKQVTIPKGMAVTVPIYAIQHDPQYYKDPEEFIPERFAEENKNQLPYLPFGLGPRSCLGSRFALVEIKTIFFHLVKNFKLVPTGRTQIPVKLSKKFSVNIRPEQGLYIGLEKL